MRLGEILAELREDKDLTQQQLADLLHISNSTVSAYELGNRVPSADTLVLFARFFGVTTDYLLGLTDDPAPPAFLKEDFHGGQTYLSIAGKLRKLLPEQRALLLGVLDNMALCAEVLSVTAGKREKK